MVKTDHSSLEHWVTENVDTPSGPTGRRARWHENLSQFKLTVEYYPGKENLIADAMSRFAYPASSSREDVCFHGSAASHAEVTKLIQRENEEGRMVGMIRLGSTRTTGSNISRFKVQFSHRNHLYLGPKSHHPAAPSNCKCGHPLKRRKN